MEVDDSVEVSAEVDSVEDAVIDSDVETEVGVEEVVESEAVGGLLPPEVLSDGLSSSPLLPVNPSTIPSNSRVSAHVPVIKPVVLTKGISNATNADSLQQVIILRQRTARMRVRGGGMGSYDRAGEKGREEEGINRKAHR